MPENLEEAITSAFAELVAAQASDSLSQAVDSIERSFEKLNPGDRLKFLIGLNNKVADLVDFRIEGIDTRQHALVVSRRGDDKLYEATALDKLDVVPETDANGAPHLGIRFADSMTGPTSGKGMWLTAYSYPPAGKSLESYVESLAQSGIENLFVQTALHRTAQIAHPNELGQIIDLCHKRGIKVIAWTYPYLDNPTAAADKLAAAARFVSPTGEHIDGLAADFEDKTMSAKTVETFAKRLRDQVGANYPIEAIVFSPLNEDEMASKTPFKVIDNYFDAIAPMSYWAGQKKFNSAEYTFKTLDMIRSAIDRPGIRFDIIGYGSDRTGKDLKPFFQTATDEKVHSISFYPDGRPTRVELNSIKQLESASSEAPVEAETTKDF